jgi:phospholipid/cholesterol/gamma-HCH transport system substrate-binding protein
MSMDRSPLRDFVVGLFVLAGLLSLAWLSLSVGGFTWRSNGGLRLSADFSETGDLKIRAPVVIAGVRVGEVAGLSLDKDDRAKVEIDVDPTLQLPIDTTASIVTAGVLGDRYIELQPGGEEQMLKNGDAISQTESAVILERVIGQLIYGVTRGERKDAPASSATKP